MTPATVLWRVLLGGLLAVACATDLRARRISNALVVVVLVAAAVRVGLAALGAPVVTADAVLAGGPGAAALGALVGLAVMLPLYALGMMGAGDVKLFAAAGAWLGPAGVFAAAVYTALAGGVLAVAAVRLRSWREQHLPYGLAIAAGVLAVVWLPHR